MKSATLLFAAWVTGLRNWLNPPPAPEPDLAWLRRLEPEPKLTVNYRPRLRQVAGRCYLCGYEGRVIAQDGDEAMCPSCGKETMSAD